MSKIKSSKNETPSEPLVEIICFCLNPNHYHLLVKQISDGGVSKFMHRLGTGYTMHFNDKNKRSGSLFQGRFKAVHIETNEYLLHLSVYINLNFEVHSKWRGEESPLTYSSWNEYLNKENKNICHKNIILDQFSSPLEYQSFAKGSLKDIQNRRVQDKVLDDYLLE
jgi:putative transposase